MGNVPLQPESTFVVSAAFMPPSWRQAPSPGTVCTEPEPEQAPLPVKKMRASAATYPAPKSATVRSLMMDCMLMVCDFLLKDG